MKRLSRGMCHLGNTRIGNLINSFVTPAGTRIRATGVFKIEVATSEYPPDPRRKSLLKRESGLWRKLTRQVKNNQF